MVGSRSAGSFDNALPKGKEFPRVSDRDSHGQGDKANKRTMALQAARTTITFASGPPRAPHLASQPLCMGKHLLMSRACW